MTFLASTAGDAAYWGLAIFLVAIGLAVGVHAVPARPGVRAALVLHQGHRARPAARDRQDGLHGRPRQLPARQGRHRHRQRRLDGRQRRHGRPRDLDRDHDPGREDVRPRGRQSRTASPSSASRRTSAKRRRPRRRRRASARPTSATTCATAAGRRWRPSARQRSRDPRRSRSPTRGQARPCRSPIRFPSRLRRAAPCRRPRPTSRPPRRRRPCSSTASRSGRRRSPSATGTAQGTPLVAGTRSGRPRPARSLDVIAPNACASTAFTRSASMAPDSRSRLRCPIGAYAVDGLAEHLARRDRCARARAPAAARPLVGGDGRPRGRPEESRGGSRASRSSTPATRTTPTGPTAKPEASVEELIEAARAARRGRGRPGRSSRHELAEAYPGSASGSSSCSARVRASTPTVGSSPVAPRRCGVRLSTASSGLARAAPGPCSRRPASPGLLLLATVPELTDRTNRLFVAGVRAGLARRRGRVSRRRDPHDLHRARVGAR